MHKRYCSLNPKKIEIWNKGQTKESNPSVMKQSSSLINFNKTHLRDTKLTYKPFNINGYIGIYNPSHHLANKAGIVYEHILIAEQILGRKLLKEEIVHHIDENKNNNNLDNLMVFATKADHTAFHKGKKNIAQNINGAYYIIDETLPNKEILIQLLLTMPFSKIHEKYNISHGKLKKLCIQYDLPYTKQQILNFRSQYCIS